MKEEIIGEQFTTNNSGVCVVTKYVGCNEVHIKFLDTGFERVTDTNSLNRGMVKDTSLSKTKKKYVIGKCDIEAECVQQEYSIWNGMVQRCKRGYAKLSDEFENFWDWLDWAKQQKGFMCKDEKGKTYQMETDLFSNGEKIYSKDTVVFVPNTVNQMCKPSKKGDLPKGVQYFHERQKAYRAYGVEFGKQIHLGYYSSLEEAVAIAKEQRIMYVNKLKDLYGETIEPKVFKALLEDKWSD